MNFLKLHFEEEVLQANLRGEVNLPMIAVDIYEFFKRQRQLDDDGTPVSSEPAARSAGDNLRNESSLPTKEAQMLSELRRYKAFLRELETRVEEIARETSPPTADNAFVSNTNVAAKLRKSVEQIVTELIQTHNLSLELNKQPQGRLGMIKHFFVGMPNAQDLLEINSASKSGKLADKNVGGFYTIRVSIEGSEWLPAVQRWQSGHPQVTEDDFGFDFLRSNLDELEVPCRAGLRVTVDYVSEHELGLRYAPGIGPVFITRKKSE